MYKRVHRLNAFSVLQGDSSLNMNSNFSNSVLILLVAVAAVNAAARFPVEESDLLNDHDIVMVMTNDNYDDSTETDDQAEVRLDGPYPEADWLEENSAEYSSSAEELRDPTVIRPGALDIEGYVFDTNRVTKTLTVDNGGHHGTWGEASFCPKHSFGAGYNMKIEPKQGSGDDTSLNAIKIVCKGLDGDVRGDVASKVGPWGHYVGDTYCKGTSSNTDFLTAFRLQVEPYGGFWKGDTAANYVEFKCRNLNGNTHEYEIVKSPGHGFWGSWGFWSFSCPKGSAICGIKTRVEASRGFWVDDTALNDAIFYCCDF